MEKLMIRNNPFNSVVEIGFKILIILDAFYPQKLDLDCLVFFDHFLIYSGDISGLESLHPRIKSRNGEVIVRRLIIQKAINFLIQNGFVEKSNNSNGFEYMASNSSNLAIKLIQSEYGIALKERAKWLSKKFENMSSESISSYMEDVFSKMNFEFSEIYRESK